MTAQMVRQRFAGRVALVTGGGSGIGRATALAFAQEGAHVVVADLDGEAAGLVCTDIAACGGQAIAFAADLSEEPAVAEMIATTLARFGRLDHALNNLGGGRPGSTQTTTLADWNWTLALSVTATWLAVKHELPAMSAGASIVNTSSITGARTTLSGPAYAVAKAGVIRLSAYAAAENAALGVRINSLSPGLVSTPLVARHVSAEAQAHILASQIIARPAMPEEVAASVLFLCSDDAAMVNGTDLQVCGGLF